eukprot:1159374-Pelagomonas_calceolata.AAC.11
MGHDAALGHRVRMLCGSKGVSGDNDAAFGTAAMPLDAPQHKPLRISINSLAAAPILILQVVVCCTCGMATRWMAWQWGSRWRR